MARLRPLIGALLGLLLLVQGFAVAAADHALSKPGGDVEQVVPCHESAPDADAASCCDADCPNMTACVLGQLASAGAPAAFASAAPAGAPSADSAAAPPLSIPQSLLRPPIVSHG